MSYEEADVLMVGGSLVGLSTAPFLRLHGVGASEAAKRATLESLPCRVEDREEMMTLHRNDAGGRT
jgi:hypothetical protein